VVSPKYQQTNQAATQCVTVESRSASPHSLAPPDWSWLALKAAAAFCLSWVFSQTFLLSFDLSTYFLPYFLEYSRFPSPPLI
jgi:hypothetical protein